MEFAAKTILLRSGRKLTLRAPCESDAAPLLDYLRTTAEETPYLLRSPGEDVGDVETEAQFIRSILASPDALMLVAEVDGELAGNCQIAFRSLRKIAHRASVAIALYKKFWGLGIGTILLEELIDAARARGVLQIELEYVDGNERARALYEKLGFVEYARLPHANRFEDGTFVDDVFMIKTL